MSLNRSVEGLKNNKKAVALVIVALLLISTFLLLLIDRDYNPITSPSVYLDGKGDVYVMFHEYPDYWHHNSQSVVEVTKFDMNGRMKESPRPLFTARGDSSDHGYYTPNLATHFFLDTEMNIYVVSVKPSYEYSKHVDIPQISKFDINGNMIFSNKTLNINSTSLSEVDASNIPAYYIKGFLDRYGNINLFFRLGELYNGGCIHYWKLSSSGDAIITDVSVGSIELSRSLRFIAYGGSDTIYVLYDNYTRGDAIYLNSSEFRDYAFLPSIKVISHTVELYNSNYNLTARFLSVEGKYIPMKSSAIADSQGSFHIFYATGGGCVGNNPRILYLKFNEEGKLLVDNKTIFVPHSGGSHCYNPDVFGMHAIVDDENNIHLVWYVNDGCNYFKSYYLKLDNSGNNLFEPIRLVRHRVGFLSPLSMEIINDGGLVPHLKKRLGTG